MVGAGWEGWMDGTENGAEITRQIPKSFFILFPPCNQPHPTHPPLLPTPPSPIPPFPLMPHLLYPNQPGSSHSCSLGLCLPLIRNGRGDQGRADRCCCERGGSVCRRQKGRCGQRAAERRRHLNHRNRRGYVSPWGLRFMLKRTDIHFPSS